VLPLPPFFTAAANSAIRNPMPAYSSTPLAQKLGFKEATRYLLLNAPANFAAELPTLPASAVALPPRSAEIDLIVFFAANLKVLRSHLPALLPKLPRAGVLWIAWPKKASGVVTDLTETIVRPTLLATGLVDIKVCSINDTWSGLKFVRRLKDRPKS
jgi:hypothetical protein